MKIINQTHWQTKHLRAFLVRAAKIEEIPATRMKRMVVRIVYTRPGERRKAKGSHGYSSGYATYNGTQMTIRVGKDMVDKTDLAHVCVHEFGHIRGLYHNRMNGLPQYDRVGNWREVHGWGETLILEPQKATAKKTIADVKQVRFARVQAAIKRWETKLKRAQNALKTYRAKERYYERQFAMAVKPPTK